MSIAKKAVRGAAWTIGAGAGSRLIGTIGTLVLTRYVAPDDYGEVMVAVALVMTVRRLSTFGFGQYVVAHPEMKSDGVFQATFLHVLTGVVAMGGLALLGVLGLVSPGYVVQYLPGLVLAGLIDRFGFVPERVLVREMRYRDISLTRGFTEISYAFSSVGFAMLGFGGQSIVYGNLLQSVLTCGIYLMLVKRTDWLQVSPLDRTRIKDMFRFGAPIWVNTNAHYAASTWDQLVFAALFGPAAMSYYALAYKLASIPAAQIGENIGDVLLPSFTRVDAKTAKRALVRATGLMALLIFPLAVGLGVVAPTLVRALFEPEWYGIAPYLVLLSVLSVVRPISWIITSYLQAKKNTRVLLFLGLLKVTMLMGLMFSLGQISDLWACAGVGIAFGIETVASMWVVRKDDGISMWSMTREMIGPLVACAPMVGVVLTIREYAGIASPLLRLVLEIAAGALIYVPCAFLFAGSTTRDFIALIKKSFSRSGSAREPAA